MKDNILANRIVASGVGGSTDNRTGDEKDYYGMRKFEHGVWTFDYMLEAFDFVRDPRVAMAKLHHDMVIKIKTVDSAAWVDITVYNPNGDEEALPVDVVAHEESTSYAINLACVEALS